MERLFKTFNEAKAVSNSTVTDKLDSGGAVQGTIFAVRREAYPRYELGRSKNLVTMKMKAICSSEHAVESPRRNLSLTSP
jgi:hypothetical protein